MTVLNLQVSASTDDGYCAGSAWPGTGAQAYATGDIRMGSTPTAFCAAGARFLNCTIPKGATINSAALSVMCQTSVSNSCNVTIYAHAHDNSATFGTTSDVNTGEVGYRTRTTANAVWNIGTAAWTVGTWYTSSDISSVIQEIVNRSGWASGNAISLLILNTATTFPAGDNRRYIVSYDYSGNVSGPKLAVTYSVPGGVGLFHAHFLAQGVR